MKRIFIVFLVLVLLIPCVASGSILSDLYDKSEDTDETIYGLKQKATIDNISVTLLGVTENKGSRYSKPSSGNIFLICEFQIENHSKSSLAISSVLSFDAYCDDYSISLSFSGLLNIGKKKQLDGTIAKGKKMKGAVAYEVSKNWKTLEIHFSPNVWDSDELVFSVQRKDIVKPKTTKKK